MADISKIKLPGSETVYGVKDASARAKTDLLPDLSTADAGTGIIFDGENWSKQDGYGYEKESSTVCTWDGDTTDKEYWNFGGANNMYRICAISGTAESYIGYTVTVNDSGSTITTTIDALGTYSTARYFQYEGLPLVVFLEEDDGTHTAGIYFLRETDTQYTNGLYSPSTLQKIDNKFIYPQTSTAGTAIVYDGTSWSEQTGYAYSSYANTVTWDGDTTGKTAHTVRTDFYKISDLAPSKSEVIGVYFNSTYSELNDIVITSSMVVDDEDVSNAYHCCELMFVQTVASATDEAGIYFANFGGYYPTKVQYGEGGSKFNSSYIPTATSTSIGGVKPVAKTDSMTQSVGVDSNGALYTNAGRTYTFTGGTNKFSVTDSDGTTTDVTVDNPVASTTTLGAVKVDGTSITAASGVISAKVKDVTKDGVSVVNASGVAILPDSGLVDDVKVNGTSVVTNKEANVTVPTKTSDLTNDSGFLTEHQSLSAYRTSSAQDTIDATKVPTSRTVNGQALSSDIELDASDITYDPTTSGLTATNVQSAIDEVNGLEYNKNRRTRKNITSSLANLSTAIAEQNLEKYGYSIGDYFVGASGYYYYLADMDTYYGGYNSYAVVGTHHCGVVVDTKATSAWLSSGTATSYSASTLHSFLNGTVLTNIKSDLTTLLGGWSNHLLSHQILDNSIGTWAWVSGQYISAMTEVQMYSSKIWSVDNYQQGEGVKPLELFQKFRFNEIYGNTWIWLRSLCSSSIACLANHDGFANGDGLTITLRASGLILLY